MDVMKVDVIKLGGIREDGRGWGGMGWDGMGCVILLSATYNILIFRRRQSGLLMTLPVLIIVTSVTTHSMENATLFFAAVI